MARDEEHTVYLVSIVWREEEKEPFKASVESVIAEGSFIYVELRDDDTLPATKHKYLYFPMDRIYSVQVEEVLESSLPKGYREDSTFREQPDKSKWFKGMGTADNGQGK